MTASTDFLAFATGGGANVESQASWVSDTVVTNGFSSGLASSAKVNKALRQGSFIAAGLATWMSQQINGNVPDDGNLTNFVTFLSQALTAYAGVGGNVYLAAHGLTFASPTTITLAQLGGWGEFTAATTATLPAIAGTTLGQAFTFVGGSTGGTIKGNASESVLSSSAVSANTYAVAIGETVTVVANGTGWQIVDDGLAATSIASAYAPLSAVSLSGYSGLKISTLGASNYISTITANSIVLTTAGGAAYVAKSVNVSPNINTSGANGLDTGTRAASTWYHVYVIYNPTTNTTAGLFSLSATAPTLPSGYTYYARVGAVLTDASGSKYLMQTLQTGRRVRYVITAGTNTAALPQMAGGASAVGSVSTPTWVAVGTGPFVPPTADTIVLIIGGTGGANGQSMVAPNNAYGAYTNVSNQPPLVWTTSSGAQIVTVNLEMMLESTNVYWAQTGNFYLNCYGWEDNL